MSRIYSNSRVVCSCDTYKVDQPDSSHLFSASPSFRTHSLIELMFCDQCQKLKCSNCCTSLIQSNFCPNCMAEHPTSAAGGTYSRFCTKNCFNCPLCSSILVMVVLNQKDAQTSVNSKVFKYDCTYCDYTYLTNPIEKPRSLSKIVDHENIQLTLFNSFVSKNTDLRTLRKLKELGSNVKLLPSHTKRMSGDFLNKLNLLNLSNLTKKFAAESSEVEILSQRIAKTGPLSLEDEKFKEDEIIANRMRLVEVNTTGNDLDTFYTTPDYYPMSSIKVPIPVPLVSKRSYQCKTCHKELILPELSPILLKYPTKWNAIDIVPTISITKVEPLNNPNSNSINNPAGTTKFGPSLGHDYLIHIINPYPQSMMVQISSFAKIATQFLSLASFSYSDSDSKTSIVVKLPIESVKIGAKRELKKNEILKSIPTAFLTEFTPASRTEKLQRMANRSAVNRNRSFDVDDTIELMENWALLPISLIAENGVMPKTFRLPLHVYVKSRTQDQQPSEYSFWTILEVN